MSAFEDDIREYDAKFEAWKTQNPGRTFAEYTTSLIVKGIEKGRPHSSLGPNLKDAGDWWEAGRPSWWSIRTHHMIRNTDKVVDYGCGSLRIGAHFMKKHFQSCYFGLDVTTDFINYGLKILDDDFLRRKKPETGTIKMT